MLEINPKEAFELISSNQAYGVDVREEFEWEAWQSSGLPMMAKQGEPSVA